MHIRMYVHMYLRTYVCTLHIRMYAFMYICMYVNFQTITDAQYVIQAIEIHMNNSC